MGNASSKSPFAHSALAVSTNVAELDGDVEARAMQLYQTKKYQQAAEAFTEAIDKYSDALHPHLLAALLTNRAACNKRCGKLKSAMDDCQHAITANPSCLRAFATLHEIRRALGLPTTDEYISEAWGAAGLYSDLELLDTLIDGGDESTRAVGVAAAPPVASQVPASAPAPTPSAPAPAASTQPAPAPKPTGRAAQLQNVGKTTPSSPSAPSSRPASNRAAQMAGVKGRQTASAAPRSSPPAPKPAAAPTQNKQVAKAAAAPAMTMKEAEQIVSKSIMQINMRQLSEAQRELSRVIASHPNHIGALIARGTSHAIEGNYEIAHMDLTRAEEVEPNLVEVKKRRAQVRSGMGQKYIDGALEDFQFVCDKEPTAEAFRELGVFAGSVKLYKRAEKALKKAMKLGYNDAKAHSQLGVVICSQGNIKEACEHYNKALELNPGDTTAMLQIAQANKEGANFDMHAEAEKWFKKIIASGTATSIAYKLYGQMMQGCGKHEYGSELLNKGLTYAESASSKPEDVAQMLEMRYWHAVCLHAIGRHREAIASYEEAMDWSRDGMNENGGPFGNLRNKSYYGREVALLTAHRWNAKWDEFCLDREVSEMFKEGFCKTLPKEFVIVQSGHVAQRPIPAGLEKSRAPFDQSGAESLMNAGMHFGRRVHLKCQGFLPNQRQWKMSCYANLELAQAVRSCVEAKRSGKPQPRVLGRGATSHGKAGEDHDFGWRDALDILVKWRQLSEPNDPVVWVDLLPRPLFEQGYGSHTPMSTGDTKVSRYFMACAESAKVMREVLLDSHTYHDGSSNRFSMSAKQIEAVRKAHPATPQNLWDAMNVTSLGLQAFYIVVPLKSHTRDGHTMEGTRLVLNMLTNDEQDGGKCAPQLEFSIRTPCMPQRAEDYDVEFANLWNLMIAAAARDELDEAADLALRMAYYWYNWLFISRGNAIVGLSVMLGFLCGLGLPVSGFVPEHTQPDWYAMWSYDGDAYIKRVAPFILAKHATREGFAKDRNAAIARAKKVFAWIDHLPRVADVLPTVGSRIEAMNLPWPDNPQDPPELEKLF